MQPKEDTKSESIKYTVKEIWSTQDGKTLFINAINYAKQPNGEIFFHLIYNYVTRKYSIHPGYVCTSEDKKNAIKLNFSEGSSITIETMHHEGDIHEKYNFDIRLIKNDFSDRTIIVVPEEKHRYFENALSVASNTLNKNGKEEKKIIENSQNQVKNYKDQSYYDSRNANNKNDKKDQKQQKKYQKQQKKYQKQQKKNLEKYQNDIDNQQIRQLTEEEIMSKIQGPKTRSQHKQQKKKQEEIERDKIQKIQKKEEKEEKEELKKECQKVIKQKYYIEEARENEQGDIRIQSTNEQQNSQFTFILQKNENDRYTFIKDTLCPSFKGSTIQLNGDYSVIILEEHIVKIGQDNFLYKKYIFSIYNDALYELVVVNSSKETLSVEDLNFLNMIEGGNILSSTEINANHEHEHFPYELVGPITQDELQYNAGFESPNYECNYRGGDQTDPNS